jgi:5-methylcytosine-specific restriction protein B
MVLAEYPRARAREQFGKTASVWALFKALADALSRVEPVLARNSLKVDWSVGSGNWARVPWIAFLDDRETTTTQHGVYPVILFREDGTGAYLALGQGVTEPKKLGAREGMAQLQACAGRVRELCADLQDYGYSLDGDVDLRTTPGLGRDYEASVIAHRFYATGAVPFDQEIVADIAAILAAYDRYIDHGADDLGALTALAQAFRTETGYPNEADKQQAINREDLASALSAASLQQAIDDPSTFEDVQFGRVAASVYGGPGNQSQLHLYLQQGDEARERLVRTLQYVLYGDGDTASRIDNALADPDWQVRGLGESLIVKALAIVYPDAWIPVFNYPGPMGKKRMLQIPALDAAPINETEFATRGAQAFESNRRLREKTESLFPDDPWGQMMFLYWLRDREPAAGAAPIGLAGLADELLIDQAWLAEVVELLRDKRQVIFYGPPGTGKTYVARKLAEYIAQDPARVRLVQFHPSYSYEDFVEGYRPASSDGQVTFELTPGPLRRIVADAQESEADWCLVIDEINRGNIAKIFGELYYLLEYRDEEIDLQYGGRFTMPPNVYVIATMNTADRSIALLDAALRRRFHFVAFFPDQDPVRGLLHRWLSRHRPGMEWVAGLVDRANALLPDRHLQIGPSHFMTPRLDDDWLDKIWRHSVLPYIEEQFFDEPERVRAFELAALTHTGPHEEEAAPDDGSSADPAHGMATDDTDA